jgi:hypothetical protein
VSSSTKCRQPAAHLSDACSKQPHDKNFQAKLTMYFLRFWTNALTISCENIILCQPRTYSSIPIEDQFATRKSHFNLILSARLIKSQVKSYFNPDISEFQIQMSLDCFSMQLYFASIQQLSLLSIYANKFCFTILDIVGSCL